MKGFILTQTDDLLSVHERLEQANADTIKIIPSWGWPWDTASRARIIGMAPNVFVRTKSGDISAGSRYPQNILPEIQDWLQLKPNVFVEVGNEPNSGKTDDKFWWNYRFYLDKAREDIIRFQTSVPSIIRAQTVAPAMTLNPDKVDSARRGLEIMHDVMVNFDFIAWHVYLDGGYADPLIQMKTALKLANEFFPNKPHVLTEFNANKMSLSTAVLQIQTTYSFAGTIFYHICDRKDLHPEYCIDTKAALSLAKVSL